MPGFVTSVSITQVASSMILPEFWLKMQGLLEDVQEYSFPTTPGLTQENL